MPEPICPTCDDTHRMSLGEREVPCTACPVPCDICRVGGIGAFCESTPCNCRCHRPRLPRQALIAAVMALVPAASDGQLSSMLWSLATDVRDESRKLQKARESPKVVP